MIQIITHRGLEPGRHVYRLESSLEGFVDQLSRGFGLEFDLRITKDKKVVVMHDDTLTRITQGKDVREIRSLTSHEIVGMDFNGYHITTLDVLLRLIKERQANNIVSVVHIKSGVQRKEDLDVILSYFKNSDTKQLYLFDTTLETAHYLKERNPALQIAPSVSLSHDIHRYGGITGETLLSLEEVLANKELFDGVWLDEWDLIDEGGGTKKLYTEDVFNTFRSQGFWIGLVTPELHATSPGLIGGESHSDAESFDTLVPRLKEIIALKPDAMCTDYPDYVVDLITSSQ